MYRADLAAAFLGFLSNACLKRQLATALWLEPPDKFGKAHMLRGNNRKAKLEGHRRIRDDNVTFDYHKNRTSPCRGQRQRY
jgi:hypothetical protein